MKIQKYYLFQKQLYNIIIEVDLYPEFLPWCKSSKVLNRVDDNNFDAILTVGYKALDENYTSRVKGIYLKKISSKAISGPFKYLDSLWTFKKSGNSCEVTFKINYELNPYFGKSHGHSFQKASEKMFDAFEDRAKTLYL